MDDRKKIWIWRARRVDAHWEGGWSVLGDDRMREPSDFRKAVERVARGVLPKMVRDEVTLRGLRAGRSLNPDGVVDDVIRTVLPSLDPDDGVRLGVVKLQLAALETLDRLFRDDLMLDHPEAMDDAYEDDKGIVEFL